MKVPSNKQTFLVIFACVAALMGYGLYAQHVDGLEPCPLCITQRFFYCLIGLFALLGALLNKGKNAFSLLIILSAAAGAAAAGRQVWLQHLPPDQVPACGPNLQYMLETFPIGETFRALITGDGNCAEVVWSFLGFSMPVWALLWFIIFFIAGIWQIVRRN